MFSQIFFIIAVLLTISFSSSVPTEPWSMTLLKAFALEMGLYSCVLMLILFQNVLCKRFFPRFKKRLNFAVSVELLIFLIIYQFASPPNRVGELFPPFLAWLTYAQTFQALQPLLMYFGGLAVFYYSSSADYGRSTAWRRHYTSCHLRFLIPFAAPFLLFTLFSDATSLIPAAELEKLLGEGPYSSALADASTWLLSAPFIILILIATPLIMKYTWQCKPIDDPLLAGKLENVCRKANFRQAGLLTWTIMHDVLNAAIIGILPRFRYVLFSQSLLRTLSDDELAAILAHEIGHSKHKHLILYPLVIAGMFCCMAYAALLSDTLSGSILPYAQAYLEWPMRSLSVLAIFIPALLAAALYFRLVVGLFSRLFERQADLYAWQVNIPLQYMVNALDSLATASGNSHRIPSWHHYSIQQRIDFLHTCIHNPSTIAQHHRRVRLYLGIYLVLLTMAFSGLFGIF